MGELNARKFFGMLVVMTVFYIWCFCISVSGLIENLEYTDQQKILNHLSADDQYTKEYGAFVMTTLILVLAILFVGSLVLQLLWNFMLNLTMWESAKRSRITYLKIYPKGYLPFYKGICGNFKEIFCHNGKIQKWDIPDPESEQVKNFFNPFDNDKYSCC